MRSTRAYAIHYADIEKGTYQILNGLMFSTQSAAARFLMMSGYAYHEDGDRYEGQPIPDEFWDHPNLPNTQVCWINEYKVFDDETVFGAAIASEGFKESRP